MPTPLGQSLGRFLDWFPPMQRWKDPLAVWSFQSYFGVRKVKTIETSKENKFEPVDVSKWKKDLHREKTVELSSSGYSSSSGEDSKNLLIYEITNWVWYYVFLFGTQLGDETYYSIFFSFWLWNIDGAVGRRVMLVWNLVMYIGQGMKDIIRWPRPAMPHVVQLESKWALEYGMPSTHAMIGLAVPASILFFTVGRYQYPFLLWSLIAFVWCALVCTSRVYLGMHSIADIYVGLVFSGFLLLFVLPFAELVDPLLLSHPYAPVFTIGLSIMAIKFYPGSDRWTPARGDTTTILGSYLGIHLGFWSSYQLGILHGPAPSPPYPILWPTYAQYGQTLLRMVVGGVILLATRAIFKPLSFFVACFVMGEDMNTVKRQKNILSNKTKIYAELTHKFVTYMALGFNTLFLVPITFRSMGIERETFFTEV